jgi:hypothetical protein
MKRRGRKGDVPEDIEVKNSIDHPRADNLFDFVTAVKRGSLVRVLATGIVVVIVEAALLRAWSRGPLQDFVRTRKSDKDKEVSTISSPARFFPRSGAAAAAAAFSSSVSTKSSIKL